MADSRCEKRYKKRLPVKFGYDNLDHIGYLSDISTQGFFVESLSVYKPGVVIKLELTTRVGETILVEGKVQWSKKGNPRLNHILKSGMGISIQKFLKGEDVYLNFHDFEEKSVFCL